MGKMEIFICEYIERCNQDYPDIPKSCSEVCFVRYCYSQSSEPDEIILDIPDNSAQAEMMKRNHPRIYAFLTKYPDYQARIGR